MINRSSYVPFSRQVYDIILSRIENGQYAKGEFLPSQKSLAQEFDVSMITVRHALRDLTEKKIISSRRGKGTVVLLKPNVYRGQHTARGLTVDSKIRGATLVTKVIRASSHYKYLEASYKLGLGNKEPIFINRLRTMDGRNIAVEYNYLNSILLNEINWEQEFTDGLSLYNFISMRKNYELVKVEENIFTVIPEREIQNYLNLEKNEPILFIKRLSYVKDEVLPIEYCEYYIIPEYYGKIVFKVEKSY